jgi:DNA-binding winged helix-turn-helix (wHTH) protein/WD40 repeat protein
MERFSPCNALKSKVLCSKPPITVGFLVTWGKTTGIYVCTILLGSDAMAEQYAFSVRDRLPPPNGLIRFANFEVDVPAGELRKNGLKIKLHTQPFEVLTALLLRHGQVVTREELQQKLWAQDTFVDFEQGLNKAINKLRDALDDDADKPRFVETLPRRGYRFVAPVTFPPGDSTESSQRVETLPRRGYPFIADVSGSAPPVETKVQEVLGGSLRTKRTHWALVLLSLGALIVVGGAVALWKGVSQTARAPKVLRFTQLTNDGQAKVGPLATDGSRVYFNEVLPGSRTIVAQVSIHGGEAVPIALQIRQPMVLDASQDGTELLIGNEEGNGFSLWVQPVAGGSPERVGTDLAHDAGFGPGAASVIYGSKKDVYSTNRDGSSSRKLLTAGHAAFAFQYSPDARVFRFSIFNLQVDDMSIMESAADGSKFRKMFHGCCGRWTSDGRYYVFQNRHNGKLDLWALPEEKRFRWWKAENEPIQLTAGPMDFQYPEPGKDNRQIFAIGTVRRAELVRYDQHSGQFLPYLSGISAEGLASSRDGQWVAYTSFPEGTLWRSKVDGTERRQLTFPPLRVFWPRWSPDGQQIAFSADLPGVARNVYLISSEGGTPKRVLASEQSQANASWSPDGNLLLFGTLFVPKAPIYTLDLRSQSVSAVAGSDGLFGPQWSPDGKFIAATTGVPGKLMLYDVSAQKWTEAFGSQVVYPTWSRDGKYIYFRHFRKQRDRSIESIARLRLSDRKIEDIVDVKGVGRVTMGTFVAWFGLGPDDSPLLARDIGTWEIYALDMEWP